MSNEAQAEAEHETARAQVVADGWLRDAEAKLPVVLEEVELEHAALT